MRKLYLCSFLIGFFALACGMWSCSDDDSNNGDTTVIEVETPASDAIFATSATFNLKTKGAESYVYKGEFYNSIYPLVSDSRTL